MPFGAADHVVDPVCGGVSVQHLRTSCIDGKSVGTEGLELQDPRHAERVLSATRRM